MIGAQVGLLHDGIDVDTPDDLIHVYPVHHGVQVDLPDHPVHVDLPAPPGSHPPARLSP